MKGAAPSVTVPVRYVPLLDGTGLHSPSDVY